MPGALDSAAPAPLTSLRDSLELVRPALDPVLVPEAAVGRLRATAGVLPPVHRAGFECRLAGGDDDVDLQQGYSRSEGDPARLAAFLSAREALDGRWERVRALARRWATGDPTNAPISDLWLEYDIAAGASDPPALSDVRPSVFARLNGRGATVPVTAAFLGTLLGATVAAALGDGLARCVEACGDRACVTHIGVMLGRSVPSMRVHLSQIPLDELRAHLERLGWDGDPDEPVALARTLLDHGDEVVVCLDFVADAVAGLGLECFFAQKQGLDPRWRPLLERLAALGLCAEQKADALLRWPGTVTPLSAPAPWPEDLVVQSLTRPDQIAGIIDRRLSHVKLSVTEGRPTAAKAYFGFGHVWVDLRPQSEPAASRASSQPTYRGPARTAATAIEAAGQRLLRARNQGGWWRDFFDRGRPADAERRVTGYASDEWVTAFVAASLAGLSDGRATEAAGHALALLDQRRGSGGWGYHALLPADADTTAWVLRLARTLKAPESARFAQGREFIEALTDADGGIHTYPAAARGELAAFLKLEGSYAGWCGAHTCVTAAAAVLPLQVDSAAHLRATQRADGRWAGHWWDDDEYTTARAIEALAGRAGDAARVSRAAAWSARRIDPDGAVRSTAHGGPSPFATALALQAIRAGGARPRDRHRAAAERAERWLLAHQLRDGSWEPSARLRVPPPDALDPRQAPELTLRYVDDDGAFTTAAVVAALAA